jgi:hypothetical protein
MVNLQLRRGILIIAFAVLCVFAICGLRIIAMSSEAERNLQALTTATRILSQFARERHSWPASLEELRSATQYDGFYSWPEDETEVTSRVRIIYGLSLDDVGKELPDNFSYVVARQPIYLQSGREKIRQLLAHIKIANRDAKNGTSEIRSDGDGPRSPE